jgi:hypothetical protein
VVDKENENVYIKFSAHDAFFGITIIRYAQNRRIEKPNNLKFYEQESQMTLNGIAKMSYCHLDLREENLSFIINYVQKNII